MYDCSNHVYSLINFANSWEIQLNNVFKRYRDSLINCNYLKFDKLHCLTFDMVEEMISVLICVI